MIAAEELASRLIDTPRGLSTLRFRKLAQHVKSPEHFERILAAIPEELRDTVRAGVLPHLPRQWGLE